MYRSICFSVALLITLMGVAVMTGGCKKKVAPPPAPAAPPPAPAPAPPPAPTIRLTATPSTVQRGASATLSWETQNAESVVIDGGIGTVGVSGNRSVTPSASTTYTATAKGPGGNAVASARVTVTEPPAPPPPAPRPLSDAEFFENRVSDVFFDFDKYDLRPDAMATLDRNFAALSERPGIRFTIEGHCDERGSERYNLALGDRRAEAAKQYLVSKGIDAQRIEAISYGEERPFDPGHDEEAWAKNRRGHFVIR